METKLPNYDDRPLRVLVASRFIKEVQADLSEAFNADFIETQDPAATMATSGACDALVLSIQTPMPAALIAALPERVRAIATYSVGLDHIDLAAAAARNIAVFNTPGVLGDSVAENTIFLMLGAARRATESIDLIRNRSWTGWTPTQLVGVQLAGRRLGIYGMGDIGIRIAQRCKALGMEIAYCNRSESAAAVKLGAQYFATPTKLFAASDVVVLACPSTDETRGVVTAELLAATKPGAILVNIARGDIVHDDALIAALESGEIAAAGLDVFAGEPRVDPRYFELPNVFMLPHIGSSTLEARVGMGRCIIDALESWSTGGTPANRVV